MDYQVLYLNEWAIPPAYYTVGSVEGKSPKQALKKNIAQVMQEIRNMLSLSEADISDEALQENIYVLRTNSMTSAWKVTD